MENLHKLEQPGVGIIWQCSDCGWESYPMDLEEGQKVPDHNCPQKSKEPARNSN